MAKENSVIIKKIKKGGHGHHGGAWKVAYADFVTAMMAFFLLLWLLSSVPSNKLQGISDFFTPTLGLKDSIGIGFSGGETPAKEGKARDDWSNDAVVYGAPPAGPVVKVPGVTVKDKDAVDAKNFTHVENDLYKAVHENPELREFRENILIEQTPEGLRIQILDDDKRPMFVPGTAQLQPYTQKILSYITGLIRYLPNYISISGHTTSVQLQGKEFDNWELSASRANTTRKYMISAKLDPEQVAKIVGRADQDPIDPQHPDEVRNMRISIVLLKNSILPYQKQSAPDVKILDKQKELLEAPPENHEEQSTQP